MIGSPSSSVSNGNSSKARQWQNIRTNKEPSYSHAYFQASYNIKTQNMIQLPSEGMKFDARTASRKNERSPISILCSPPSVF